MTDDEKALQLLRAVRELEAWRKEDSAFRNWRLQSSYCPNHKTPTLAVARADGRNELEYESESSRDPVDAIIALAAKLDRRVERE